MLEYIAFIPITFICKEFFEVKVAIEQWSPFFCFLDMFRCDNYTEFMGIRYRFEQFELMAIDTTNNSIVNLKYIFLYRHNNVNFVWLSIKLYLFYSFDIYNTKIIATFSVHWFHGQPILQ